MTIKTKYGNASINNKGYYTIGSTKEGNFSKLLHRLIYEDYHGVTLLKGTYIHHIDHNKLNNDISNLQPMTMADHTRLHHTGAKRSEETKRKIRENRRSYAGENHPCYNTHHTPEAKRKMSESHKKLIKEKSSRWGSSIIEEWGGLWFLIEMKKQKLTMTKVSEYTGINMKTISTYLRNRDLKWSTLNKESVAIGE